MRHGTPAFLFLLLWAGRSPGQNLLLNPDFDINANGWAAFADGTGTLVHVGDDAGGDPGSGSVKATTDGQDSSASGVGQCPGGIVGGTSYDVGCRMLLLSELPATTFVNVSVAWFSSNDCSSGELGVELTPDLDPSAVGFWTPSYVTLVAPESAESARVSLVVFELGPGGSPYSAQFDGAILAPQGSVPLPVLVDGFESEDLSAWQVTQP